MAVPKCPVKSCRVRIAACEDMIKHLQTKHRTYYMHMHICQRCCTIFTSGPLLRAHEVDVHGSWLPSAPPVLHTMTAMEMAACPVCGKSFLAVGMHSHMRTHMKICTVCNRTFPDQAMLDAHQKESRHGLVLHLKRAREPSPGADFEDDVLLPQTAADFDDDSSFTIFMNTLLSERK